jgi:hypothetical protein
MALAGTARVLRWRGATRECPEGMVDPSRLEPVADLPYGRGADHPEGLELWPEAGRGALLVVYDAPGPGRLDRDGLTLRADLVRPGP